MALQTDSYCEGYLRTIHSRILQGMPGFLDIHQQVSSSMTYMNRIKCVYPTSTSEEYTKNEAKSYNHQDRERSQRLMRI